MSGPGYSSDLTDAEWMAIGPWLGEPGIGCPARPDLRYVINGILFLLRSGTAMRTSSPWSTAEAYYARWQADGVWVKIEALLRTSRAAHAVMSEMSPPQDGSSEKKGKSSGG